MILIKLWGRLGNQMFQYAAARLTAERLCCALLIEEPAYGLNDTLRRVAGRSSYYSLFSLYRELHPGIRGHGVAAMRRLSPAWTERALARLLPNEFKPARPESSVIENNECFDSRFFDIVPYTRMYGFYQSERYFAGHEPKVRSWFGPKRYEEAAISAHWDARRLDPQNTVAVHVRLGDYRRQGTAAAGEDGWILPRSYYDKALASFGAAYPIALFSDQPRAAREFLGREVAYLSNSSDIKRDLFLMASCSRMVIANSSFSWWAAWLNPSAGKTILAPKYHVGWRIGEWYSAGIHVEGWTYL
jgi:Glycosyl transferase family 11